MAILFEQLGYPFDHDTIPKTIAYYKERTSHGSTLSRVVTAWVLARSDRPESWRSFKDALDSDISDIQGGTTREGIHTGAMAGAVDLVQRCFVGIQTREDTLHFDPCLPENLDRIGATLRYRQAEIDIEVTHEQLRVTCRPSAAAPVTIAYRSHHRTLRPGASCAFHLFRPEDRDRDENRGSAVADMALQVAAADGK